MAIAGTRAYVALLAVVLIGCNPANPPTPSAAGSPVSEPPAEAAPVGRVDVEPSAVLLTDVGQTAQLVATATDARGAAASVTWRSSDPSVVAIDASGRVTALADLGSALVFAETADRSTPVVVLIAEPAPGAVLVADDQVLSEPLPIDEPTGPPANGDRYHVTLSDIEPPAAGSILLATGSAEIGGRVTSATASAGQVDVEYELVPLPQMLARYDIDVDVPLDLLDAGLDPVAPAATAAHIAAVGGPMLEPADVLYAEARAEKEGTFEPGPLTCKLSAAAKFKSAAFDIKVTSNLALQMEGRKEVASASTPEHTKVALTGPVALDVIGGLRAEAGFEGKAECELKTHIPVPFGGVLAVVVAVTVPLGLAVGAEGSVKAVDVELGPKGHLGTNVSVGFQCDSTACWALKDQTPDPNNGINFEAKVNLLRDSRVEANVALNLVTGLGFKLGTDEYSLIDAKIGPVQSLNLAFDEAQARDSAYASAYDLKFAASIAPADDLKTAISRVFGGAVTLDLSVKYESEPLASSPTGMLTAEKARVQVGKPVKLWVDLDPKTIDYFILGPNVAEVRIARWKDNRLHPLQTIPVTASGQTRFEWTWTPTDEFEGMNELVAYVGTNLLPPRITGLTPVPLEIAPNSTAYVEVVDACLTELPTPAPPGPGSSPGSSPVGASPAPTAPPVDPCAGNVFVEYESTSLMHASSWNCTGNIELYEDGMPLAPEQPTDEFIGTGNCSGTSADIAAMAEQCNSQTGEGCHCNATQVFHTGSSEAWVTGTLVPEGWPGAGFSGPAMLLAFYQKGEVDLEEAQAPWFDLWVLAAPAAGGTGEVTSIRAAEAECGEEWSITIRATYTPTDTTP